MQVADRMKSTAEKLQDLRTRAGLSMSETADALGWPKTRYGQYENPKRFKRPYLPPDMAAQLADIFAARGVPRDDVLALAYPSRRVQPAADGPGDYMRAAAIAAAHAGIDGAGEAVAEAPANGAALAAALRPGAAAIWMRCQSNSMNRRGILPGDFLLIDPAASPKSGQAVVAVATDGTTGHGARTFLRAYYAGLLDPDSTSPGHDAMRVHSPLEVGGVHIAGVVVTVLRDLSGD